MVVRPRAVLLAVLMSSALAPRGAWALADAASERVLASQTRLAAALLVRLTPDPGDGSVMVSPSGLAGMLSPLTIAGDEAHRSAMAEVLQIAPGPTRLDDLDAIRGAASASKPGDAIETSTRYVFAPNSPPTSAAAQGLARLGVEILDADPGSKETQAANDAWVSKVTHGRITEVEPVPSGSALATFNAFYFNAGWENPFSEAKTAPADFHSANGDRLRTPFMHSGELFSSHREDARFLAVELPFAGRRYSMVILTTKDAAADLASFADHLSWLDGEQFRMTSVIVDLPRFSASSKTELLPLLVGLGLDAPNVSSGLAADTPMLGEIVQKMKLNVFEKGSEVVGLTEGFVPRGALRSVLPPEEVTIDKPFAFSVVDWRTGLIIAAGFVSRVDGEKLAADVPAISARFPPPPPAQPNAEMRQLGIDQRRALQGAADQYRKVQP